MVADQSGEYRPRRAWTPPPDDDPAGSVDTADTPDVTDTSDPADTADRAVDHTETADRTADIDRQIIAPRRRLPDAPRPEPVSRFWPSDPDRDPDDDAGRDLDADLDADDAPGRRRPKLVLLLGGLAAFVAVALAVVYSVHALRSTPTAGPTPTGSAAAVPTSAPPTSDPNVVLTDAAMLTSDAAKPLDPSRTWKVAMTQKGEDENSPQAACLSATPPEGSPVPQQVFLRTLTTSGKDAPAALHQAESFASTSDAAQAFTAAKQQLGGCPTDLSWITGAASVRGLGDDAVGVTVAVLDGSTVRHHSLLLNRTGRIVNVLDVARPGSPTGLSALAASMVKPTNRECTAAVGQCASAPSVQAGPPPAGGDQPGFLAAADIPQIVKATGAWTGTVPGKPQVVTSQCEDVDFATVKGPQQRLARTYLLDNPDRPPAFGIDEVVLTMRKDGDARDLVSRIEKNLSSCKDRSLTASVASGPDVQGTGAGGKPIKGSTVTVTQKVDASTSADYRVGIASVGSKVVYTFVPPSGRFDFSDGDWAALTVRAAQRASQAG